MRTTGGNHKKNTFKQNLPEKTFRDSASVHLGHCAPPPPSTPAGGQDWRLRVAVDPFTRMAPSIEATTANMQALLERVQADMRAGQAKRLPNGAAAGREPVAADHEPATAGHEPATRRMPKGLWGQREYWLKPPKSGAEGRWLKKMRDKPGDTSKQDRPPEMTTGTPLRKTPPPHPGVHVSCANKVASRRRLPPMAAPSRCSRRRRTTGKSAPGSAR